MSRNLNTFQICVSHINHVIEHTHDIQKPCENCGVREHVFIEDNIIDNFMKYLGMISDQFKRITVIAHNMQKYDGHFLLQYMYKNTSEWCLKEESLIMNGSKILQIKIGRYRFIDSLNFFSVGLAKLPSMFNLECKSKGFYPHFFNTPNNFNYIGELPDMKYYGVDTMKTPDRSKFIQWYNSEKSENKFFNNKQELIAYCKQDVNILRLACLKFRSLLFELTSVDPFDQVTIAGTCMNIFKSNFIKEYEIAIIPANGYRLRDKQSFKALKWMEWISHTEKIQIQSAINGREIRISNNIVVDGYCYDNNTIYEFLGCYWHQCQTCFPIQFHEMHDDKKSFHPSLYDVHVLRCKRIKDMGFNLICIWEHEFDSMFKANEYMRQYLNSIDHLKIDPLNPRDAFYGGRTGVCRLYHKTSDDEKILYYDVTSLYPYINKYCAYPIGIPKILIGSDLECRTVFNINGIIKCRVLPPKDLYHPVLPIKMHSKLLFILCFKCATELEKNSCFHIDEERAFDGTYIAEELRVAVQKGYKILKIYEAWEYELTKYNPETKEGGIFVEYINTFLKIKTEASGYPTWCKTEEYKINLLALFTKKKVFYLIAIKLKKIQGFDR